MRYGINAEKIFDPETLSRNGRRIGEIGFWNGENWRGLRELNTSDVMDAWGKELKN